MSWTTRNLHQSITIWSSGSLDAYGNPVYNIKYSKGRWEDLQVKALDSTGEEVLSKSVVYLSVDVKSGDYIALGMVSSSSPSEDAREVISFSKIPSISGKVFERKAVVR